MKFSDCSLRVVGEGGGLRWVLEICSEINSLLFLLTDLKKEKKKRSSVSRLFGRRSKREVSES